MPASKNQNYLHGAAILTVAVIITKILGAIYKIPMANILGPKGFAHFSVAYNLYAVLLTLSTAGLPIALSKLVSEANSLDRPVQIKKTYRIALISFMVLGAIGTAVMFMFPTELAVFMEDVEASHCMFAVAPSVILVCIMSAFRGYTQGLSDMRPTSVSQVIEVAVKVFFGIAVMVILDNQGKSAPILASGAISGVSVGSLAACIYMGIVAVKRMKSEDLRYCESPESTRNVSDSERAILKRLLKVGIPIAIGSSILSVITLINTKLILGQLQNSAGFSYDASTSLFGVYSTTLPLFNLPAAVITPLTISIVPAIAGYIERKQFADAKDVIESSLRIATIIALPMAVGLSVLSDPVMYGLYGSRGVGSDLLLILGAASFFVCLSLMTTAILQASSRERLPVFTMLIGGGLNIVLNWFLVGNPDINIYGAPIGTLICYVAMSGLNLWFVMNKLPERPKLGKVFFKPLINCIVMGAAAWIVYPAMLELIGAGPEPERKIVLVALLGAIAVAVLVYAVMTIITKAITLEDMKLIPKGEKIAKLLRIR
ncbi:MAG: polysaccharide biosynthesis protein [Clostridiales bacterium]|nr:polysaccharide biosynthesis protein [Clostridiales bacterium]